MTTREQKYQNESQEQSGEATARPWKKHADHIFSPSGKANICTIGSPRLSVHVGYSPLQLIDPDFAEAHANGELIVRAVNAHDDLLAALRVAKGYLGETRVRHADAALIDAAIARATP